MTLIVIDTNRRTRAPRPTELRDTTRPDLTIDRIFDLRDAEEQRNEELALATWEDAEWQ